MGPGGYAFIPPGADWTLRNTGDAPARFHWIRKAYERVEGIDVPPAFVTSETDVAGRRDARHGGRAGPPSGSSTRSTSATTCTSTSSTSSRAG